MLVVVAVAAPLAAVGLSVSHVGLIGYPTNPSWLGLLDYLLDKLDNLLGIVGYLLGIVGLHPARSWIRCYSTPLAYAFCGGVVAAQSHAHLMKI